MVVILLIGIGIGLVGLGFNRFGGENGKCLSYFLMLLGVGITLSIIISAIMGGTIEASKWGMETIERGAESIKFEQQSAWAIAVWFAEVVVIAIFFKTIDRIKHRTYELIIKTIVVIFMVTTVFPSLNLLLMLLLISMLVFVASIFISSPAGRYIYDLRRFVDGVVKPELMPYLVIFGLGSALITFGINPLYLVFTMINIGLGHLWTEVFESLSGR